MQDKIKRIRARAEESEKSLERKLREGLTSRGALCLKYSNPAEAGYPDRLIIYPGGAAVFAEIKSKGEKPRPLQAARIGRLRGMGVPVAVVDSPEKVGRLLEAAESPAALEELRKGGGL